MENIMNWIIVLLLLCGCNGNNCGGNYRCEERHGNHCHQHGCAREGVGQVHRDCCDNMRNDRCDDNNCRDERSNWNRGDCDCDKKCESDCDCAEERVFDSNLKPPAWKCYSEAQGRDCK